MADFDLTQTDAQVQSILNDGQNMQGAGAQTTLTTESVLLKDVNGNYHKILKSSFTEAIRDTLAGLLVNNDKGTTINQIAAIASGDFGSITPANLASVLGGFHYNSARDNTTSFDDLPQGSIRLMGTSNAGRPSGTQGKLFTAITFYKPYSGSIGGILQLAIKWQAVSSVDSSIYVRQTLEGGGWTPWNTITLTQ